MPWTAVGTFGTGSTPSGRHGCGDCAQAIAFPRDVGRHATVRPLDDYSNTYIALHSMDPAIGSGHYKYGEYQYVCTAEQIAAKRCFDEVDMYQLFDLVSARSASTNTDCTLHTAMHSHAPA